jgi:hypothetical protein
MTRNEQYNARSPFGHLAKEDYDVCSSVLTHYGSKESTVVQAAVREGKIDDDESCFTGEHGPKSSAKLETEACSPCASTYVSFVHVCI